MIDNNGRASLTSVGLYELIPDGPDSSTTAVTGAARWMSPELLFPERFGLSTVSLTMESDCYALGMVVYEVLSGQQPFPQCSDATAVYGTLMGERPERPRGGWFLDDTWEMLEQCWRYQPSDRPSLGVVLRCLQGAASQCSWLVSNRSREICNSTFDYAV